MSSKSKSDYGKFELTAGNFYGDVEKDKGKFSRTKVQGSCNILLCNN